MHDICLIHPSYYGSSRHSDITLYLGPDKVPFPGHRFILRARCFHACINEVQAKGGYVLYFEDHPVGILKLMLQYIYTGDYNIDLGTTNSQAGITPLLSKNIVVP